MSFTYLSSRLTLAYKLLIPIVTLLGLGIYMVLMLTQHWPLELHGVVALFSFVVWLLFVLLFSLKIRHIAYNDSFIRIKNYGPWIQIPNSEYILLDSGSLPGLYQFRVLTGEYLFLASYFGTLAAQFRQGGEPVSVTIARRTLTKA
ncbi:hypothetical protein [Hymenobacter antarcticus]|uniref:PH domain-containing protein n=1 Tax=Hymenobacter antarcticus TaxID=486270 RepID=A0ABP7R2R1_9BACT